MLQVRETQVKLDLFNLDMEREYDRPNQGEGRYGDDYYNSSTRDYYKYDNPPEYDSMLMRYYDRQKYSN